MYLLPLPDRTRTAVAAMTERRDPIPQPGDTIEVNGKPYEISGVDISAEMSGETVFVSVRVRTKPSPERVEVTIPGGTG